MGSASIGGMAVFLRLDLGTVAVCQVVLAAWSEELTVRRCEGARLAGNTVVFDFGDCQGAAGT